MRSLSTRFLALVSAILILLWLPNMYQPLWADTAEYAILGRGLWHQHAYILFPDNLAVNYPFLYPFLAYIPSFFLGYPIGMKAASLLSGMGVLAGTFFLAKRTMGFRIAAFATTAILLHHGFILFTTFGSADLLFTALFLFSLYSYVQAESDQRYYILCGLLTGLACLTRYNGVPLFLLFFLFTVFFRTAHLRRSQFWIGMILGGLLFSIWPLRNFLTLGTPLPAGYLAQMKSLGLSPISMLWPNLLYYGNPLHNILPVLLILSLWGMLLRTRWRGFLLGSLLTIWLLTAIWWSQSIRQAFPGYPILMIFAGIGFFDLYRRIPYKKIFVTVCIGTILFSDIAMLCIYSYGSCNARIDRFHVLPQDLHLTQEGMYTWKLARDFINETVESGATIVISGPFEEAEAMRTGVFRDDLIVKWSHESFTCPAYEIVQRREVLGETVFQTEAEPITSVVQRTCLP